MHENISPSSEASGLNDDTVQDYGQLLRDKILFGLEVYPFVSPTMMHTFLGTATPSAIWKEVLNHLIAEELVVKTEVRLTSPHDRVQSYTVLHLASKPYCVPTTHEPSA